MKTYNEEIADSHENAFERALEEKDSQEATTEAEDEGYSSELTEDIDFEVTVGEPEKEEAPKEPSTAEAISKLADALTAGQPKSDEITVKQRPGVEVVDVEAVRKEFNDKLHESEDPFTVAMGATEKVFGPQIAAQARVIQELKRDNMKTDPDKAYILNKYAKAVENVVAELPAGQQNHPDVYVYAVNKVMQENIDEVIEHKVEERLKAKTTRTAPGAVNTLGPGLGATPPRKKQKVYATKTDEAQARKHGLSLRNYLVGKGKI
jgi:hypothetical protein